MALARTTVRRAALTVTALGLAALVVRPAFGSPTLVASSVTASPSTSVGVGVTDHGSGRAPTAGVQVVVATVPAVTFTGAARAHGSHLRVPVALMDPTAEGSVVLAGAPACTTPLVANTAVWVDCDIPAAGLGHRLTVRLEDGREFVGPSVTRG